MALDHRAMALSLVGLAAVLAAAFVATNEPSPSLQPTAPAPQLPTAAPPAAASTPAVAQAKPSEPKESLPVTRAPEAPPTAPQPQTPPATEGKAGASAATNPKFTHFRVGNRNVKRIFVDGEHVWVGTSGGVIRYRPSSDEFRLYDARSGLRATNVVYVGKLRDRIAVGSYGGGMAVLDARGESWESFGAADGLGDDNVSDALAASNGDVWIATRSGANRVRGGALQDRARWESFTVASTRGGLPNDHVYALAEGRDGDIWVATEGGTARYSKGQWSHWLHGERLNAEREAGVVDAQARLAKDEAIAAHKTLVAANPNFNVAVAVDRAGTVWAGTLGGGLARFKAGKWTYYTRAEGLPGNHVFVLLQDERRRLWIGTDNGLARLEGDAFKVLTTRDGLFVNAVFALASEPGSLWVGGYGGVARIRDIY